LATANFGNVAGDAEIDEDIVQRREVSRVQATNDVEPGAEMDVDGNLPEPGAERWKWESLRRHVVGQVIAIQTYLETSISIGGHCSHNTP
jgi:hypothetical protein